MAVTGEVEGDKDYNAEERDEAEGSDGDIEDDDEDWYQKKTCKLIFVQLLV